VARVRLEYVCFDEDGATDDVTSASWAEITTIDAEDRVIDRRYVDFTGVPWGRTG
jgi:hypothetical protein